MKHFFVQHFGSLSGTEAICLGEREAGMSLGKELKALKDNSERYA